MKKLDQLLIKGFIPPFVVTFFIALFVLIMQFLWTYIDDIAGKDNSIWVILELLGYLSMSLVPTALPIAILISSVMVMGNLAERYELASMKSAGVPLWRIMQPLMFVGLLVMAFSFFCSNTLIPIANLKFKSRLHDIRKQKPTLSLDAGIFNDDFKNFAIFIGEKGEDNRTIRDVILYDHRNEGKNMMNVVTAKSGEMYATSDGQFFVMNLINGVQYRDATPKTSKEGKRNAPFNRVEFKEWKKVFDLGEFDLNETNRELFKSHQTMLSAAQLQIAIDSIDRKITRQYDNLEEHFDRYIYLHRDTITFKQRNNQPKPDQTENAKPKKTNFSEKIEIKANDQARRERLRESKAKSSNSVLMEQDSVFQADQYQYFAESFLKKEDRSRVISRGTVLATSVKSHSNSVTRALERIQKSRVKHVYELHIKFSMAVVCFIFLFIGAPMGAIIRKGGFGYPILVSIIFFVLFIVLTIFCKKLAKSFILPAEMAAWTPCLILFPVGLWLTYKAMNDSKLINLDRLQAWFERIGARLFKAKVS